MYPPPDSCTGRGWSQLAIVIVRQVTLALIPETRGFATARATRGFQSGQHCRNTSKVFCGRVLSRSTRRWLAARVCGGVPGEACRDPSGIALHLVGMPVK